MKWNYLAGIAAAAVFIGYLFYDPVEAQPVGGMEENGTPTEIIFDTKAINLSALTSEIQTALNWTRATANTAGFSGLTLTKRPDGTTQVFVVWTDNGEDSYKKELTALEKTEIEALITLHNAL